MNEPDQDASRAYIWTIACVLFVFLVAGGGCLLAYIIVPNYQSSNLLPVLGLIFVCMPWIFWIATILYRLLSRTFGFRMVLGGLYVDNSAKANGNKHDDVDDVEVVDADVKSNKNDGKDNDISNP
ncbi:hypothetical protein HRI_003478500 [Hibiscus trionum]|uniref:Uncharacterized protein n=1 Tax=Hibiscus trionum TaxID=183268 RepID=A0A9W7IN64_HIBTR|nr:hypothetical protein HRI_003478500 [Hibiscus trionum]